MAKCIVQLARSWVKSRLSSFTLRIGVVILLKIWMFVVFLWFFRLFWLLSLRIRRSDREWCCTGLIFSIWIRRWWSKHWDHTWRAYLCHNGRASRPHWRCSKCVWLRRSHWTTIDDLLLWYIADWLLLSVRLWYLILILKRISSQLLWKFEIPLLHQGLHFF